MVKCVLTGFLLNLWLALGAAGFGSEALAQGCLSADQAREAAQAGQVMPLSEILGQIQGEILPSPQLCNRGGRYVYVVNVLKPDGEVSRLTVDAASGNIIGY
jgi:hypothetical protein